MNFQKVSIILLIILLAGCVSNRTTSVPEQPTIPATNTTTKIAFTGTPVPLPTETVTPTFTPVLTATPLKLTKQEIANALEQRDYEKFCITPYYRSWSPNKQWLMVSCRDAVVAQIINLNTGTIYSVDISYYYPLSYKLQTTIRDELWSTDGKYLFLRPHICCADGPGGIVDGVALYRVDLTNGDVWTVLPPSNTEWADYAFAFSPNEKYLAYVSPFEPNVLHILDSTTKQEVVKEFDSKFHLGGLVWTQGSKQIVFVGITHNIANDKYSSSIFFMNTKDLSFDILIDNDSREFVPIRYPSAWIQKDIIQLFSLADDSYWSFNIRTKSLSLAPTPTP